MNRSPLYFWVCGFWRVTDGNDGHYTRAYHNNDANVSILVESKSHNNISRYDSMGFNLLLSGSHQGSRMTNIAAHIQHTRIRHFSSSHSRAACRSLLQLPYYMFLSLSLWPYIPRLLPLWLVHTLATHFHAKRMIAASICIIIWDWQDFATNWDWDTFEYLPFSHPLLSVYCWQCVFVWKPRITVCVCAVAEMLLWSDILATVSQYYQLLFDNEHNVRCLPFNSTWYYATFL